MAALFLAFVLLPMAELYLLIRIGKVVGAAPTVALVVVMGLLGAALAKSQGRKVLEQWRTALAEGRVPTEGVVGGILVLAGGILLITPGVITDVAGFLCLVPFTRRLIGAALTRHLAAQVQRGAVQVHSYGFQWPPQPPQGSARPRVPGDVIDTDGEEIR